MFPNSVFAHPTGSFNAPVVPPDVDPDSGDLSTIRVSCLWLPYIRGALTQLLLQSTWKTDADGLQLTQQRAQQLISMFNDEACGMCDCLEFNNGQWERGIPDGSGGTTFVPVDPRNDGDVPPPWPIPPGGQTGNCLSAANSTGVFKAMMVDLGAKLTAGAVVASALVAFESWLDLALPLIGEVIQLATEMAAAALDAGAVAVVETFDPSEMDVVYHALQCALSCNMEADGSISGAGLELALTNFSDYLPGPLDGPQAALWLFFVTDWLHSQGKNGITLMGKMSNISSSDCDDCGCDWCYNFPFTGTTYDWTIVSDGTGPIGTLTSDGVEGIAFPGGYPSVGVVLQEDWTGYSGQVRTVEIHYDFVGCPSAPSGNDALQVIVDGSVVAHRTLADMVDGNNQTFTYHASAPFTPSSYINFNVVPSNGGGNCGSCLVRSVLLRGPGDNPYGSDNC